MEYGLKNYQKAEFPDEEGIQVYIKDAVNKGNHTERGTSDGTYPERNRENPDEKR